MSPVSIFEVTALHTAGRLRLARSPEQWLQAALDADGVRVAPISPPVASDAGQISREALGDPLDRLLVGTARQIDATLVTCDARILDYAARLQQVRVHDGST